MFDLDLRTVILITGARSLLLALLVGVVYAIVPRSVPGVGLWVAAPLIVAVAAALFALRGQVPDLLSVVVANLLLLIGMLALLYGSQRFFGLRPRHGLWLAALVLAALLLYAYRDLQAGFMRGCVWSARSGS